MFDNLNEKISEFVEMIKSKFSRNGDVDDDEESEFEESTEEIEIDDDLLDDEDEKKNKRSKLIKIVAILAIVFFALDEFVLKEESPRPNVVKTKKQKKRRSKRSRRKKIKSKIVNKKTKNKNVKKKENLTERNNTEKSLDKITVSPQKRIAEQMVEKTAQESIDETKTYGLPSHVGEVSKKQEHVESVDHALDDIVKKMKTADNKLANKLEVKPKSYKYVAPPSFVDVGRGLVYNCVGKHWACVDKKSYVKCRSNYRWSLQNKKSPECVAKDVYSVFEDCRKIQVYKINISSKISFCKL